MAIELLDLNKQWAKVRAALKGGKMWRSPSRTSSHPYTEGYDASTQVAQQTNSSSKMSVFGGKTFSQRK